ncbi:MAG: DUF5372 family protein [Candidatus Micrarchaeaceae archaeon]
MTHPFHPLTGQQFELFSSVQNWGEERVYYLDSVGELVSIPAQWTDAVPADPFIAVAAGSSALRVTELVQLVKALRELREK